MPVPAAPTQARTTTAVGGRARPKKDDISNQIFDKRPDWNRDNIVLPTEGKDKDKGNIRARPQTASRSKNNNEDKTPTELDLTQQIINLKHLLSQSTSTSITQTYIITRTEKELTRSLKDNKILIDSKDVISVKELLRITKDVHKSLIVRDLNSKITALNRDVQERDVKLESLMRSVSGSALLEVTVARDENYREVLRLRGVLKGVENERDNLGLALEDMSITNDGEIDDELVTGNETKHSETPTSILKSVIKAQHSRIQELKEKLTSATAHSLRVSPSSSNNAFDALTRRNPRAVSPAKRKEMRKEIARGFDLLGQEVAKRRISKSIKVERNKEKERIEGLREDGRAWGENL